MYKNYSMHSYEAIKQATEAELEHMLVSSSNSMIILTHNENNH